jgi:hypothetical protein
MSEVTIDESRLRGPWAGGGPGSLDELEFTPQPMVRWLNPRQLCGTATRAVLSSVFGAYADQREVQAALAREVDPCSYVDEGEIWIDYVSDLGDGFDSTYTVAWLLAQDRLQLREPAAGGGEGKVHDLPRGRVLVMGGDQVYPTASREEYTNRMSGPYEAALPCRPADDHPDLYAIPGNHDWYDGLTSFLRLFCQKRWIGGWRTRQTRSYFAVQLPHGWWLLGTDFQLRSDIDKPQLDYFTRVAREAMKPGDRVILCTPEPTWVHVDHEPAAFDNLAFFEQKVLGDNGVRVAVTLAGDLHHYARYAEATGERHKITAGGGGAYLYGTDRLPRRMTLDAARVRKDRDQPTDADQVRTREVYTEQAVYPRRRASMGMRGRAVQGVLKNGWFTILLASFYLLFAWVLQASPVQDGKQLRIRRFMEAAIENDLPRNLVPWTESWAGAWNVLAHFGHVFRYSPLTVVLVLVMLGSLKAFCAPDAGRPAWLKWLGLVHGAAHVALAVGLTWALAELTVREVILTGAVANTPKGAVAALHLWWFPPLFGVHMLVVGGLLGGVLFGLFLLPGVNLNEAFSSQHLTTYRNFLRLHIDTRGELTVYPVGVPEAVQWKLRPNSPAAKPFFEPKGKPPAPELIEPPVKVNPRPEQQKKKVQVGTVAAVNPGQPEPEAVRRES